MDGNVTREGITADLEAMQRVGIGGLLLMDITQEIPPGPVRFFSPEWRDLFQHTVREAERLGLQLSMNNDAGWCGSGGPWVTPELSMQRLVYSLTNIVGGSHLRIQLPKLPTWNGHVWDVATLAFPTRVGDGPPVPGIKPRVIAAPGGELDFSKLSDQNASTTVPLPLPRKGQSQTLLLTFADPFRADQLSLTINRAGLIQGSLQVSEDGRTFRPIRDFMGSAGQVTAQFATVTGRSFRIALTSVATTANRIELAELQLAPLYRIEAHQLKNGMAKTVPFQWPNAAIPDYATLPLNQVVDLSAQLDHSGWLEWDAPPGHWTICRFGHMPTGRYNPPARPGGYGLECDKLSQKAIDSHFEALLGKLIADNPPSAGRALAATHIDSWEVGFQNWTPLFRQEFQRLRGYDPLRYLPAFTGRIVENLDVSERFLWDVRRTIADLLATNYAGRLAELAHRHGMQLSAEAYGNGPFDNLLYASRVDVPMSEFWNETDTYAKFHTSKTMASAAHVYGKPIVAAEAFTAWPEKGKWQNHPFALKKLADTAFVYGVNRLAFVRYAHQPWTNQVPGMTMGHWGIHYERTQTWWEFSKPWHDYVTRCQFLLQSGHSVADVCYLTDEGAFTDPPSRDKLSPALPPGYDYDLAPPDALFTRFSARDGASILPDGSSYRVLVLPQSTRLTPAFLKRVKELVEAGATVVGSPPEKSPSLNGFPACDQELRDLSAQLWSDTGSRRVGKGLVLSPRSMDQIFAELKLPPDFIQQSNGAEALRYIHRRAGQDDFYFVANRNSNSVTAECTFRVTGRQPELWQPDTGATEPVAIWRPTQSGTAVHLRFDPFGSVFVVFRRPPGHDPVVSVGIHGQQRDQSDSTLDPGTRVSCTTNSIELTTARPGIYDLTLLSGKVLTLEVPPSPEPLSFTGPWEVTFQPNRGAPPKITMEKLQPWNVHPDPGVRFYSGQATYSAKLEIAPARLARNQRLFLDLGRVAVLAEIKVNGTSAGILWKPPFVADITNLVRPGENSLEIIVVNLWPNRLIGDEHLPDDCQWNGAEPGSLGNALVDWPSWLKNKTPRPSQRLTFTTRRFYTKDSPLLESGLLGPVMLFNETTVQVEKDPH